MVSSRECKLKNGWRCDKMCDTSREANPLQIRTCRGPAVKCSCVCNQTVTSDASVYCLLVPSLDSPLAPSPCTCWKVPHASRPLGNRSRENSARLTTLQNDVTTFELIFVEGRSAVLRCGVSRYIPLSPPSTPINMLSLSGVTRVSSRAPGEWAIESA